MNSVSRCMHKINEMINPQINYFAFGAKQKMSKFITLAFLVIPTGAFFGYDQCERNSIYFDINETVSALQDQIRRCLSEEFNNITFTLRAIDYKMKTYREMKSENKISAYFDKEPNFGHIHILVESVLP